jgi:hypothetical protein
MMGLSRNQPCEQVTERRTIVNPNGTVSSVVVFVDEDLGEECLIEQTPGRLGGLQIGSVTIAGQIQAVGQG